MSPAHVALYAIRSLGRGGSRALLAVACAAFGMLSLLSMLLLADMVRASMLVDPRATLGGDFSLSRADGPLTADDVRELDAMRARGRIREYALTLPAGVSMMRREGSGRVYLLSRAIGVDPAAWPLVGDVVLNAPAGANLAGILHGDGVIVTRDIARRMDLAVGDAVTLGGAPGMPPIRAVVAGIATRLPDRRGDTVLLPLSSARALADGALARAASVLTDARPDAFAGWSVRTPEDAIRDAGAAPRVFGFALKGAGLLGLLVGGVGLANTLQVVLARRSAEIAVLKTLGYRYGTLLLLFCVETGLLGLAGSVLGAAGALLVAGRLASLLDRLEGSLQVEFFIDPTIVAAGITLGIATSVLFGMQAIVRAAAVRPATLLRQLNVAGDRPTRAISVALNLALAAVCALVGTLVMGSALQGIGVIAAGAAALIVLGAMHALLLALIVRVPLGTPLVRLAQRSVRHRPVRALFAVVALFIGIFTIGFAGAALLSGRDRVESRRGSVEGTNLMALIPVDDEAAAIDALRDAGAERIERSISVAVRSATRAGEPLRMRELSGRDIADVQANIDIVEGVWTGAAGTVLLPRAPQSARTGDLIEVETVAGSTLLTVAGVYQPAPATNPFMRGALPIVDRAAALRLANGAGSAVVVGAVPPDRLEQTADRLGSRLPHGIVLSRADVNALMIRAYEGLFAFVVAIAGLALLAGAVLIANAVGLGLLERRKELGVLKAVGWSRFRVLGGVLLENGILGALAGVTGMAGVAVAIAFTNARQPAAELALRPEQALVLAGAAIALALVAAAAVAWRPTAVRPLVVLREE